jgi:hypothetical protein
LGKVSLRGQHPAFTFVSFKAANDLRTYAADYINLEVCRNNGGRQA